MKIGIAGEVGQRVSGAREAIGALQPAFADDARALILTELFGTPYSESVLGALEHAIIGSNVEYQALEEVTHGHLAGVALCGLIAGTVGTARIFFLAGGSKSLVEATVSHLTRHGARLVIAELPDDRPFDSIRTLLLECDFREESRVDDLVSGGVALTFLRREATVRAT